MSASDWWVEKASHQAKKDVGGGILLAALEISLIEAF